MRPEAFFDGQQPLCRSVLSRPARVRHNFAGERMVVAGMPGKGKSQLVRSLLSQAMAQGGILEDLS